MITFSKLGKHGNLGNQLHQIASLIGFSKKYNCELVLPEWKYAKYFVGTPAQAKVQTNFFIEEKDYHYIPEFWDSYADIFRTYNVDILGWLQSEKYWLHCKEKVHKSFRFKPELHEETKLKFKAAFKKRIIAISIRRGDFITNPNFYLLPIDFYLNALVTFFPSYKDYNIIIFSDDLNYCKMQIKSLPNIYFATGLKDIGQLCLMSMCDHFIISNSSFSWWGAMLGEKKNSIVIRSPYQLQGDLVSKFNTKDYYPERWIIYDHVGKQKDLPVITSSEIRKKILILQNKGYAFYKQLIRRLPHKVNFK
jgi:hypothetical protein